MQTSVSLSPARKLRITKATIAAICSYLLAALFIYASVMKLQIYSTFVTQIHDSPIIGQFANILAWLVPGVELLIAAMLIFRKTRLVGLWSAFALMILFTVWVYIIPHFFHSVKTCSCGGIISNLSWKGHFWFNLSFTIIAGIGLSMYPLPKKENV